MTTHSITTNNTRKLLPPKGKPYKKKYVFLKPRQMVMYFYALLCMLLCEEDSRRAIIEQYVTEGMAISIM